MRHTREELTAKIKQSENKKKLAHSDKLMARGFEDFVNMLVQEGVIQEDKIPAYLKKNMNDRELLRGKM